MATSLTVQTGFPSITPTANPSDATGNYVVVGATDEVVLRFANTSGAAITVTLDDPNSTTPESAQTFNPDVQVSVPATTGVRYITLKGARLQRFRDQTTGRINWTPSAATGLAVEVVGL